MANFIRTLFCAGFGGQGVMVFGQLIAYAGIDEGRYVTWIPSYGPEMRGGTANCAVVVSDVEIGSPFVSQADIVVAFNQPSLDKYEGIVKPGGTLLYNCDISGYENPREDIHVVAVPASRLAREAENDKALNIVMLGALVELTDIIDCETAVGVIKEKLGVKKPQYLESNLKAFAEGRRAAIVLAS